MSCTHKHAEITASGLYKYCPDCGAVASKTGINTWSAFHSCEKCRLPVK